MIISLLCFMLDLLLMHYVHYTLHFMAYWTLYQSITCTYSYTFIAAFGLLMIQDFILTDSLGLTGIYMIPIIYVTHYGLGIFSNHPHTVLTLGCILTYGTRTATLVYNGVVLSYTGPEIAGNIIVIAIFLIYTLQGRSGNRFYPE